MRGPGISPPKPPHDQGPPYRRIAALLREAGWEVNDKRENGYCESFNARLRDEFLNGEVFYSLRKAEILVEQWRRHYNTRRPHSALGYRPPAPETFVPLDQRPVMH